MNKHNFLSTSGLHTMHSAEPERLKVNSTLTFNMPTDANIMVSKLSEVTPSSQAKSLRN